MKKSILSLCCVAALATSSFASTDMMKQLEALKAQIAALEAQINSQSVKLEESLKQQEKKIVKVEKTVDKTNKTLNEVKAHDAGDNIKWDVDFRTQVDSISYKLGDGTKLKNEAVMSNRLWLNMKFQADENSSFFGTLSYNKLYGDNLADDGTNNFSGFDWVTNESATNDNSIKVKEAFWLYANDTFLGTNVPWTASVGRRPSTDGLGINFREGQERKSALSHTVNVEFDGASFKYDLDKVTGIDGMWMKFCFGRGLTNARLRFDNTGNPDFTKDGSKAENIDMAGLIFVPYDDGQYSVHTNYAKAWNLIGIDALNPAAGFKEFGDLQLATIMFKTWGVGNGISDFLDDTSLFVSAAMSKTDPNNTMLGSSKSETGHSLLIGANMPCPISEDARVGIEWNKGSKYWRSMTYGEDTMVGSKISARGTAWEVYRHQQLTEALSFTLRYTYIDYDYTGSNGFFGDFGAPQKIGANDVAEAQNITANIRYRF
ncbi:MAG: DUF3373 family protein [Arcobacteraceae bacterium]